MARLITSMAVVVIVQVAFVGASTAAEALAGVEEGAERVFLPCFVDFPLQFRLAKVRFPQTLYVCVPSSVAAVIL